MKNAPEKAFILEFLKTTFGNGRPGALKRYFNRCAPSRLNRIIHQQGLSSFFLKHSGETAPELNAPGQMLNTWKEYAGRTALKNTLFERESIPVFDYLNQNNIEYALLKGFSYTDALYGNRWARPIGDIDILVKKKDYPSLKNFLLGKGFRYKIAPGFQENPAGWVKFQEAARNDMGFYKKSGIFTFLIEVHWDIANLKHENSPFYRMFRVETDAWLNNTSNFFLGDTAVKGLSPSMHFIHTVHHFAYGHQYAGIKWLLDICLFADTFGRELEWDLIRETTARPGCRKLFAVAGRMAAEIIGEKHPTSSQWREVHPWNFSPADYRYFKSRLFARRSLSGAYISFMFMPEGIMNKWKMASYILFNRDVSKRWDLNRKTTSPLVQPLCLLSWAIKEKIEKKR